MILNNLKQILFIPVAHEEYSMYSAIIHLGFVRYQLKDCLIAALICAMLLRETGMASLL